jgi:hypothetical protein
MISCAVVGDDDDHDLVFKFITVKYLRFHFAKTQLYDFSRMGATE